MIEASWKWEELRHLQLGIVSYQGRLHVAASLITGMAFKFLPFSSQAALKDDHHSVLLRS